MSTLEIDALQYLAGYIIRNLQQKSKRLKYGEAIMDILTAFIEHNHANQTLIAVKNRGGLTAVNEEGQQSIDGALCNPPSTAKRNDTDVFVLFVSLLQDLLCQKIIMKSSHDMLIDLTKINFKLKQRAN